MPSLFLGAGAVVALGLPTLRELEKRIVDHLGTVRVNGVSLGKAYAIMLERRRQDMGDDFEGVMAAAKLWLAGGRVPFSLRMVLRALQRETGLKLSEITELLDVMTGEVERVIHSSLSLEDIDRVLAHYEHIRRVFEMSALELGCVAAELHQIEDWKFDVFTTNWDTSLEILTRTMKIPISDGFAFDSQRDLAFNEKWCARGETLRVFKLHGSIDQFVLDSGKIVKGPLPPLETRKPGSQSRRTESGPTLYGEKVIGRSMLYPNSHQGPFTRRKPFAALWGDFKEAIAEDYPIFIVGCSFNDYGIVNALNQFKRVNRKLLIGYVGGTLPSYAEFPARKFGDRIEKV